MPDEVDYVFDADALLGELRTQHWTFKLGGQTFRIPQPTGWSDELMEAAGRNEIVTVARLALDREYPRFVDAGGSAMLLDRIIAKMAGAPMGESSASSQSSAPTARPSNPTASTTTGSTS